jgi:uncharacterized protein YjbI with pentapeptide repeats
VLTEAELFGANLSEAELAGADLTDTNVSAAELDQAAANCGISHRWLSWTGIAVKEGKAATSI